MRILQAADPGEELRLPPFGGAGRFPRLGERLLGQPRRLPGALVCLDRRRHGRLRRFGPLLQALDGGARRLGLDFQIAQPVFLGQPARRGRRRLGGLGKAVPAPEIALDRDETLPGFQMLAQGGAQRAGNEADLGEAAIKRRRRRHPVGQRRRARGQDGIAAALRDGPVRGGVFIVGSVEVFAERRAERRFIALGDDDAVEHRRPFAVAGRLQQLAQRAGFGFEFLRLAFGLGQRAARKSLLVARQGQRGFSRQRLFFGLGGGVEQAFGLRQRFGEFGVIFGDVARFGDFVGKAGEFGLKTEIGLFFAPRRLGQRIALRLGVGESVLRRLQRLLRFLQFRFGLLAFQAGLLDQVGLVLAGAGEILVLESSRSRAAAESS